MTWADTNPPRQYYAVRLEQQATPAGPVWTAEHPALLGCHVVRTDPREAIDALALAREEWLSRARVQGRDIPEPGSSFVYHVVLAPEHTPEDASRAREVLATAAEIVPELVIE